MAGGRKLKEHCFRLRRGQDIYEELKKYVCDHHIKAATIVSAVGCVSQGRIRNAGGINIVTIEEPMEIVSVIGTLSEERMHIHCSFSKEDLSTIGGHMVKGCIVNTTAEIVLLELDEVSFGLEFDKETGYDELVIKNKSDH